MGQDPSENITLRIAMSIHSLIYAPLYHAAKTINSKRSNFCIEFDYGEDERGYGDHEAYEKVCSHNGADLCVCDPMVVVNEAKRLYTEDNHPRPSAVIIGVLVQRPALWLVRLAESYLASTLKAGSVQEKDSLAYRVNKNILPIKLGRVMRYKKGSSAYYYLRDMKDKKVFEYNDIDIEMGDEREYLSRQSLRDGYLSQSPDVIMTCELLDAYKYKEAMMTQNKSNPIIFAWHRYSDVIPFTALVANLEILNNPDRQKCIINLLSEVEKSLKDIIQSANSEEFVQAFLSRGGTIPIKGVNTDSWEQTLDRVQTKGCSIFPASIRTDKLDWDAWKKACDVWGISRDCDEDKLKKFVNRSIDKEPSQIVSPYGWREHIFKKLRYYIINNDIQRGDMAFGMILGPVLAGATSALLWKLNNNNVAIVKPVLELWQLPGFENVFTPIMQTIVIGLRICFKRK